MTNLIRLLCLLLLVHTAVAQTASPKLGEDPVFTGVLARRIVYPASAEQAGIYAKIYAGFRIDERGLLQDVKILNPTKVGYGFEQEVTRKLNVLPPLNPKYEGAYALPVIFAIKDYTSGGKLISPSGDLSAHYLNDRVLLSAIKIVGSKTPVQQVDELAPYRKNPGGPPNR